MSKVVTSSLRNFDSGELISNVISQKAVRKHQQAVINHLDKVVSCTYGPMNSNTEIIKGNNDPNSIYTEFTKDGHTVVSAVNYQDTFSNAIAKEIVTITHYTEGRVGDGTTTAVKLSAAIFNSIVEYEKTHHIAPCVLVRKFQNVVKMVTEEIMLRGKECTLEDIWNISLISTNGDENVADIVTNGIYKQFGMSAFVDVRVSSDENTYFKEYDGMTMEVGFADPSYMNNLQAGECTIDNPKIYAFKDPIDTPEMANFLDKIIQDNIFIPYEAARSGQVDEISYVNTVIMAPKISRDSSKYMSTLVNFLNQFPAEQKPPILILTNIESCDMEQYSDIYEMCKCNTIEKYIDSKKQELDQKNGIAPTFDTVTSFCGSCAKVVSDGFKTKFINPAGMYDKVELKNEAGELIDEEGNVLPEGAEPVYTLVHSAEYTAKVNWLEKELVQAEMYEKNTTVRGRLRRRLNSIKGNLVEVLVGGIDIADRDSLRALVEDAVLNCRSAARLGVGQAANCEGLLAITKVINERDLEDVELSMAWIIKNAYITVMRYLYGTVYEEAKAIEIVDEIQRTGVAYNLINEAADGTVLTSIDSDPTVLDAISKIVTIMMTANQALVQYPALNVYHEYEAEDEE